jgi:hypothetical protein
MARICFKGRLAALFLLPLLLLLLPLSLSFFPLSSSKISKVDVLSLFLSLRPSLSIPLS